MRPVRLSLLATMFLSVACTQQPPSTDPQPELAATFDVSSLGSRYALRARLFGTVRYRAESLEVFVDSGSMQVSGTAQSGKIAYRDVRISAGVGLATATGWRLGYLSDAQPMRFSLADGETMSLGRLHFVIRGVHRDDAQRGWLAFQFDAYSVAGRGAFATFACAGSALFGPLNAPPARGTSLMIDYVAAC